MNGTAYAPRSAVLSPLLEVEDLSVVFRIRNESPFRRGPQLRAVDCVSIRIRKGETLGLVGESGSGKSTTGAAIAGLVRPSHGSIRFQGEEIFKLGQKETRELRKGISMVFQDPYSSLNPAMVVEEIVGEPLRVHTDLDRSHRRRHVVKALEQVGLSARYLERYPYQFSGGQRQRIAIARAIVLRPDLIILDEPTSSLDVSTQAQIINLLKDLQDELELSYLFISHDLAVVRNVSHRLAVMYMGRIVEEGPTEDVYLKPAHPYTEALLAAIPDPRRRKAGNRLRLPGERPNPLALPRGCAFASRCAYELEHCHSLPPPHAAAHESGFAACHLHESGPVLNGSTVSSLRAQSRKDP